MTFADPTPSRARIETLLSARFGTPVRVGSIDRLAPWSVLRCRLTAESPRVPVSVIVKWLRDDPRDVRRDPAQVHTERAALEYVAGLDSTLAPRLVTADPDGGVLILEDLAPREPLRDVLLRDGSRQAADLLISYARTLARLHAASTGSNPAGSNPVGIEPLLADWQAGVRQLTNAGAELTTAASGEFAGVLDELTNPATMAFSNGDPGLNNYLVDAPGDGRLIDFEFARFRHPLGDLINDLYVPGPMWLTVGDPLRNGIEEAYREILAPALPEVADDGRFDRVISGAGFAFATGRSAALAKLDDRPPGDHGRLNRVAALAAAADTAERHRCLPHLTSWARRTVDILRRRWPDTDLDLSALGDYATRR